MRRQRALRHASSELRLSCSAMPRRGATQGHARLRAVLRWGDQPVRKPGLRAVRSGSGSPRQRRARWQAATPSLLTQLRDALGRSPPGPRHLLARPLPRGYRQATGSRHVSVARRRAVCSSPVMHGSPGVGASPVRASSRSRLHAVDSSISAWQRHPNAGFPMMRWSVCLSAPPRSRYGPRHPATCHPLVD